MANFDPLKSADAEIVGEALSRYLLGRPTQGGESLEEVRTLYGSTTKAQTSTMARELSGSPEYGGSRRYASVRRRLERYETGSSERRRADPAIVSLLRVLGLTRPLGPMLRDGLLVRVRASVRASDKCKVHTMPIDRAGRTAYQRIEGSALQEVADAWRKLGDPKGGEEPTAPNSQVAGELLLRAFFDAYKFDPREVCYLEWVEIRPGNAAEQTR